MAFIPDPQPTLKFVPDAPPAEPAATPKPSGPKRVGDAEEAVVGPSQILGSMLLNIPAAAGHAALDLYHRISGQETPTADKDVDAISVHPGAAGKQLLSDLPGVIDKGTDGMLGAVVHSLKGADTALGNVSPTLQDVVHQAGSVAGDLANLAAPIGAVKTGKDLVDQVLAANAERSTPKFRSSEGSPVATMVAGNSGRHALILHNQAMADATLGGEAGVPSNGPLNYDTLEQAREAPLSVYNRAADAIPTGPMSAKATQMIQAAGRTDGTVVTGGPDVQANVQSIRDQLLAGPQTGQQVIRNMRKLRQEGFTNISSDDVSNQQLGKAQIDMANALEQHVSDSIPPGANVDMNQLAAARTALAKNFAVQSALRGPHVDLQAIARMQRADPDLLTGNLKDAADFANNHPEVATLPNATARYTGGPNVVEDMKKLNPLMRPVGSAIEALGGWAGRRLLTGDTESQIQNARTANPGGDVSGAFAPKPPGELVLRPPPGTAFEPHQPQLATPDPQKDFFGYGIGGMTASTPAVPTPRTEGAGGGISLADVLSHGVEQNPAPGLSLAPDYAPPEHGGIPFRLDPNYLAGDLSLADRIAGPTRENLSDVAGVRSQGVPDGTVQRAAAKFKQNKRDLVNMNLSDLLGGK